MCDVDEKTWSRVTMLAERGGYCIIKTTTDFELFTNRHLVGDSYCILGEVECSVCEKDVSAAYYQWKKDDWYAMCKKCFCN